MAKVSTYPVNTTPALTDRLLLLDDPAGSPAINTVALSYIQPTLNRSRLVFYTNTAKTIVNSSSETTLLETATVGSYTFAANSFAANDYIRIRATGTLNTIGSPGDLTLNAKFGSQVIATSNAVTLVASQVSVNTLFELEIICLSPGASGSFVVEGYYISGDGNGTRISLSNGGTAVTVDSTVALTFNLTGQFSVADPSNILNTRIISAERIY